MEKNKLCLLLAIAVIAVSYKPEATEKDKQTEIFLNAFSIASEEFIDSVPPEVLIKNALRGMYGSLDKYSQYFDETETIARQKVWEGQLNAGIGVSISEIDGTPVITDPYENQPAHLAGIKAGDEIIKVNDRIVKDMKYDEVIGLIRGNENEPVSILVNRPHVGEKSFIITRKMIRKRSVGFPVAYSDTTGYIKVYQFLRGSANEMRTSFSDLKSSAPGLKFLILDLRDNTGGLVKEAVEALGVFVPKGTVACSLKTRKGAEVYRTESDPVDTSVKILLLVNANTISSGEVFAGAMQDLDRAVIAGEATFGKGIVQGTRFPGYNTSVYLTTARYYTPSGRSLHRTEIKDTVNYLSTRRKALKSGGGVYPDIPFSISYEPWIIDLMYSNFTFNYITDYIGNTKPPADLSSFVLKEDIVDGFLDKAATADLTVLPEEAGFKRFLKENPSDELAFASREYVDKLKKLRSKKLLSYKKDIRYLLETRIVKRNFMESGELAYATLKDPQIYKAFSDFIKTGY